MQWTKRSTLNENQGNAIPSRKVYGMYYVYWCWCWCGYAWDMSYGRHHGSFIRWELGDSLFAHHPLRLSSDLDPILGHPSSRDILCRNTKGSNPHLGIWRQCHPLLGNNCPEVRPFVFLRHSSPHVVMYQKRPVNVFQPRENPTKMSLFSSEIHARQPSQPLFVVISREYVRLILLCRPRCVPCRFDKMRPIEDAFTTFVEVN